MRIFNVRESKKILSRVLLIFHDVCRSGKKFFFTIAEMRSAFYLAR